MPYSVSRASNIYGIGSGNPFPNYWTLRGGFTEVVQVLPRKEQTEVLLEKYFESVDPIISIIDHSRFYHDYNALWLLDTSELSEADGPFLGLLLIMLAMATQFLILPKSSIKPSDQKEAAEFYACACHQSLQLSAYFNVTSVRTLQAMTLMTYYLLNDNRASDGWAFAGILVRQAYALGLNREPSRLDLELTTFEKQERRILWRAITCQDAFMSMILRLPPGTTHADVDVPAPFTEGNSATSHQSAQDGPHSSEQEWCGQSPNSIEAGFISGIHKLALLVQECISSPRSLSLPIATTPRRRSELLTRFRTIYSSMPDIFRGWNENSISELAGKNRRLVRQMLFFASNYWHCVMLVQAEGAEQSDNVGGNIPKVRSAIEAALEAIRPFFAFYNLLQDEASVWWVLCHKGFMAALILAGLLQQHGQRVQTSGNTASCKFSDPLFERAMTNVQRMIDILQSSAEQDETAQIRVNALRDYI